MTIPCARSTGVLSRRFNLRSLRCYWDGKTVPLAPVDDVRAQAKAFEAVWEEAVRTHPATLHPRDYPLIWSAVLEGARRVPKSA